MVAHCLSTIENEDLIVVLKEGKVEETGTYQELMENQKLFFLIAQESPAMI